MLQLPGGRDDDELRQLKFDAIAKAMPGFGGAAVEIRWGAGTVDFTASATSAGKVVSHGLSRTPSVVIACEVTTGNGVILRTNTYTSTSFTAVGTNPFGSGTYSASFAWIAIG